jgi:hypothetical protein
MKNKETSLRRVCLKMISIIPFIIEEVFKARFSFDFAQVTALLSSGLIYIYFSKKGLAQS